MMMDVRVSAACLSNRNRTNINLRILETRLETTVLFEERALPGTEHVGVGAARMPDRRGTAYFLAGQSPKSFLQPHFSFASIAPCETHTTKML
jgi:hypothetical protein